uniref:Uncharacterized protein n=1 Tax=Rhizophora mucronata TaxID=61149 RepID=A0A2P2IS12_RHIMU
MPTAFEGNSGAL